MQLESHSTAITAHISANFHFCSFHFPPPHEQNFCLSVCLSPWKPHHHKLRAPSKSIVMERFIIPHTLMEGEEKKDRQGPISISMPDLNPRESQVVSQGFDYGEDLLLFMEPALTRLKKKPWKLPQRKFKKIPKLLLYIVSGAENKLICQSMPSVGKSVLLEN